MQHVARERGLARARHARDRRRAGRAARARRTFLQVVQTRTDRLRAHGVRASTGAARCSGCRSGVREKAAGDRIAGCASDRAAVPCADHLAAAHAGAGPEVDHVLGAADGVLVVLDDDQRVALRLELGERVEQDAVVARMQADRRLVEDVADAAQIGAELRGEPDALRFAARQRRRRAVEREIDRPTSLEETRAAS